MYATIDLQYNCLADIETSCSCIFQSTADGTLHISRVEYNDGGLYTCVAINNQGPSDSWATNITVMGKIPIAVFKTTSLCECVCGMFEFCAQMAHVLSLEKVVF